jgi:hypothetical protein
MIIKLLFVQFKLLGRVNEAKEESLRDKMKNIKLTNATQKLAQNTFLYVAYLLCLYVECCSHKNVQ